MKTTEIQLHSTSITGNIVKVDYSILDGKGIANVKHDLSVGILVKFIEEEGLNQFDNCTPDAATFLTEETNKIVELYLTDQLCIA